MPDTLTITLTDEEVYLVHKVLSEIKNIPEDDLSVVLDVETRLKDWLDRTIDKTETPKRPEFFVSGYEWEQKREE